MSTETQPTQPIPTVSATSARVLIIDDSALIRKAVNKILESAFTVIEAADGMSGLEILKNDRHINLVIVDLVMPGIHGFDVVKAIRASKREDLKALPIIVITGQNVDNALKLKALDLGADDFIPKPFTSIDLFTRVKSFCKHQQETKNLQQETKSLQKQVTVDAVSGLITKKTFDEQLEKDISRAIRHREELALMLLEIKNTKNMLSNDLIKVVSKVLLQSVRKEDTVARIGTGLFAISLPCAESASALEMAQRMCDSISSIKAKVMGKRFSITVAMGVCGIEIDCCPAADQVFKTTKEALLEAKLSNESKVAIRYFNIKNAAPKKTSTLSIDKLLLCIEKGDHDTALLETERAIIRLQPLMNLLSKEQRKKLLK